jgi:hypothetical protein
LLAKPRPQVLRRNGLLKPWQVPERGRQAVEALIARREDHRDSTGVQDLRSGANALTVQVDIEDSGIDVFRLREGDRGAECGDRS